MTRLTADRVQGIWAGVTMSWNDKNQFDEQTYRQYTERICAAGVHGVYTSGSTGEFYALSFDEFCRMVDIQAEVCSRHNMPLQIGCCADATWKTIQMLEYAASKPQVGAAQVVIPYWMEITDRELLAFFTDLHRACPDLPLVHYNINRAKRYLNGEHYRRILEVAPNLIGIKWCFAGSHFGELQEAIRLTPQLSYFTAENMLASAMMLGSRGSYSSLVFASPRYMLEYYACAARGDWQPALAMQREISQFYSEAVPLVESLHEGVIDPVFDKGLAAAAGFSDEPPRTRAPYIGWSEATVRKVRNWLKERYPQFVFDAATR